MLRNTLIILLTTLLGAPLAQAQTPVQIKSTKKTVWAVQDVENKKIYPIDKPLPRGNGFYKIINQTNPSQSINAIDITYIYDGVERPRRVFKGNMFSVGMMKTGDECRIKVLELVEKEKRLAPKKQIAFNLIMD
jgi:hypothetical protein